MARRRYAARALGGAASGKRTRGRASNSALRLDSSEPSVHALRPALRTMLIRSRLLRILLIVLLVVTAAGYFAFASFLFNPTESDYEADISSLVPRDVDFFVAKANLSADFKPFPTLAIEPQLTATKAWQTFVESPEGRELEKTYDVRAQLDNLRTQLKQLKGIDPLGAFGGRDLAIAGYFKGPDLAQADWAVYGRANWFGKLGASLLWYPTVFGLDKQGIAVAIEDDHVALSGGPLQREIYVTRVRDVVVLGTSKDLVLKARDLQARGGEDSFGQSATYNDSITRAHHNIDENEIEFALDWHKFAEKAQINGRQPDVDSQEFITRLAGRLFQLGALRSVAGVVGFDHGIGVDIDGELSSEVMTPLQKTLYRSRGRESEKLARELAHMARADSQVVAHIELDLGDFLGAVVASLDEASRQLIDDALRSTGQFGGLQDLVNELDRLFKGRVGVIVRANDYPMNANDPPHNNVVVPAIAVVLWCEASEKTYARIEELQTLVSYNQARFGLRGPEGKKAVYTNRVQGGFEIWEYWSPMIDGTGHIATVRDNDRYIISNSYRMLGDVLQPAGASRGDERLSDRPEFNQLVDEGLKESNVFVWLNPRTIAPMLRDAAKAAAEDEVRSKIDWDRERAMAEQKAVAELFPGKQRGHLSADEQAQVNAVVEPQLQSIEQRVINEQAPALRAAKERQITYAEACSGALLMVALDPKQFQLTLGTLMPLEAAAGESQTP